MQMPEDFPMTLAEMQAEILRLIKLNHRGTNGGKSESLTLERMIDDVLRDLRAGRVLSAGAALAEAQEYAQHWFT